jgi:hypothetical protein
MNEIILTIREKKTAIPIWVLIGLVFVGCLFISCQRSPTPEDKKEVPVSKEESKQQPSEVKQEIYRKEQEKPIIQSHKEKFRKNITVPEKKAEFKEPILLWEREFDSPIREISDQNRNGEFLAIQLDKEEMKGKKILILDSKGNTKREEILPEKKKVRIPAEQLWLTANSEEDLQQLKKAKNPKEVEVWGREIYISGNGEYYATVIQYSGWYEFEYKDHTGKTLWKINPQDNYGFSKAYISYDGSRIIIIDMGGLGGGDEWEVLGQRIYLYDKKGKLLNNYDFGERVDEWINPDHIRMSKNSQYIGGLKGWGMDADRSVVLFNKDLKVLWNKTLWKRHMVYGVSDTGELLIEGNLDKGRRKVCLLNRNGLKIWSSLSYYHETSKDVITNFRISKTGKYIMAVTNYAEPIESGRFLGSNKLSVIATHSNKILFHALTSDLFDDPDIVAGRFADILEENGLFCSISGHSYETPSKYLYILIDLNSKKILWKGKNLGKFANDGRLTIIEGRKPKVYLLDLGGGYKNEKD